MKRLSDQGEPPDQICIFKMEEEVRAESINRRVESGRYNQETAREIRTYDTVTCVVLVKIPMMSVIPTEKGKLGQATKTTESKRQESGITFRRILDSSAGSYNQGSQAGNVWPRDKPVQKSN
jgi:hypothetical protein